MRIAFLGDSITEGCGASAEEFFYVNQVGKTLNAKVLNYGVGGTRIARQQKPSSPDFDHDFCERFSQMDDDAELVVVFGGTNDFGHGDAEIGELSDRTPDTFYGACHYLMEGLIKKYPDSTIVIMTPLHRCDEDNVTVRGERKVRLVDYVNIIKEVAAYYSLPVIDLWSMSGIQPRVDIIKEKYCPDGLHPNDAGHELLAERIGSFLLSL